MSRDSSSFVPLATTRLPAPESREAVATYCGQISSFTSDHNNHGGAGKQLPSCPSSDECKGSWEFKSPLLLCLTIDVYRRRHYVFGLSVRQCFRTYVRLSGSAFSVCTISYKSTGGISKKTLVNDVVEGRDELARF